MRCTFYEWTCSTKNGKGIFEDLLQFLAKTETVRIFETANVI